jgi:alpha-L-fucosidase
VTGVRNFRTGANVGFSQGGGNLTLTGVSSWDTYDTVFTVTTAGRQGIYPPSTYTMSASASASGHGAAAAADGSYLTYWDSNRTLPVSLRFDLGAPKKVRYLAVNQREWSPTHNRSTFGRAQDSARIRDYRVYFSADGVNWGSPVRTGTMPSQRGVQIIDLPATTTRHVRLEVTSTWSASSVADYAKLLAIDEAWIGSDYAGGATTPPTGTRYESENATISQGVVESNHAGFSGTGFVNYDNAVGGYVQWTVTAAAAGPVTLSFRYANGTTVNRPLAMSVNGGPATTVAFNPTGAWTTWQAVTTTATLAAGTNTVRATATVADGGPNSDYLEVTAG